MMRFPLLFLLLLTALALSGQPAALSEVFDRYAARHDFHGVALVATGGRLDFIRAAGTADRAADLPMRTDARFKIASITKTFTAVLILQLMEEGQLRLDGKIGDYLPDYRGEARDRVTIHHLLTYSSGLPNSEGDGGIAVYQRPSNLDSFIVAHCSGPLQHTPGTTFHYNNGDYTLLGKIVAQLRGQPFEAVLRARILAPLGMRHTGMLRTRDIVPGLVPTYNRDDSSRTFYADDPMYIENYFAAGAMYATIEDLLRFDRGLFDGRLLKPSTLDLMLTPYPEFWGCAYGFWVNDYTFGKVSTLAANRQGSIWGANANWLHLMQGDKTILLLSNTNATNLSEMAQELAMAAYGQEKLK